MCQPEKKKQKTPSGTQRAHIHSRSHVLSGTKHPAPRHGPGQVIPRARGGQRGHNAVGHARTWGDDKGGRVGRQVRVQQRVQRRAADICVVRCDSVCQFWQRKGGRWINSSNKRQQQQQQQATATTTTSKHSQSESRGRRQRTPPSWGARPRGSPRT
jgi:hypothetical protein